MEERMREIVLLDRNLRVIDRLQIIALAKQWPTGILTQKNAWRNGTSPVYHSYSLPLPPPTPINLVSLHFMLCYLIFVCFAVSVMEIRKIRIARQRALMQITSLSCDHMRDLGVKNTVRMGDWQAWVRTCKENISIICCRKIDCELWVPINIVLLWSGYKKSVERNPPIRTSSILKKVWVNRICNGNKEVHVEGICEDECSPRKVSMFNIR